MTKTEMLKVSASAMSAPVSDILDIRYTNGKGFYMGDNMLGRTYESAHDTLSRMYPVTDTVTDTVTTVNGCAVPHVAFKRVNPENIPDGSVFREHDCLDCGNTYRARIVMSASSPGLSGERTQQCPLCDSRRIVSSATLRNVDGVAVPVAFPVLSLDKPPFVAPSVSVPSPVCTVDFTRRVVSLPSDDSVFMAPITAVIDVRSEGWNQYRGDRELIEGILDGTVTMENIGARNKGPIIAMVPTPIHPYVLAKTRRAEKRQTRNTKRKAHAQRIESAKYAARRG